MISQKPMWEQHIEYIRDYCILNDTTPNKLMMDGIRKLYPERYSHTIPTRRRCSKFDRSSAINEKNNP